MPVDGGRVSVVASGDPQRPTFGGGVDSVAIWHICQIPAHIPQERQANAGECVCVAPGLLSHFRNLQIFEYEIIWELKEMRIVRNQAYPCCGAASSPICELLYVSFYGPVNPKKSG